MSQLENIPLQQLPHEYLEPITAAIEVFLDTRLEVTQVHQATGAVVGKFDARYSKILHILQAEANVVFQAYIPPTMHRNSVSSRRFKYERMETLKLQTRSNVLSVVLYGTMNKFEEVGNFLSDCSEYLQSPLRCDRDVPYRNPQSLYGWEENQAMTSQLQSGLSFTEMGTLA